ncbi:MAG TPA: nucleoside triphosphate pyrophosphohydrolase [Nitriliruptorales bacterium]
MPEVGQPRAGARVVLVETSDALPGLLPFQAWDALARADLILLRDLEQHPAAPHLYLAGLDLLQVEPVKLEAAELDLNRPGSAEERRVAKALLQAAAEHGTVTYVSGPGDEQLSTVLASMSPAYDAELELVFFAQQPRGAELLRLVEVMARLRDSDGGCPWDLEQDHASLKGYLVEETYELLEAIDGGVERDIAEELGDVLLQVVFHAQIGTDRRAFTIDDVARGIADKLERRHPHVFGDVDVADAEQVQANWDELKVAEKGRTGPFDGVPAALPALMLAEKLQRKAAKLGFAWPDVDGAVGKVREELDEVLAATGRDERTHEVGDLLAATVSLARHLGVEPEDALRQAAGRFRERFEAVHALASAGDREPHELTGSQWLELWEQGKAR